MPICISPDSWQAPEQAAVRRGLHHTAAETPGNPDTAGFAVVGAGGAESEPVAVAAGASEAAGKRMLGHSCYSPVEGGWYTGCSC